MWRFYFHRLVVTIMANLVQSLQADHHACEVSLFEKTRLHYRTACWAQEPSWGTVYKSGARHPPAFSVSNIPSKSQHLCKRTEEQTTPARDTRLLRIRVEVCCIGHTMMIYCGCKWSLKGTQDWEFYWLRLWNLRYFFVSYVKILRFYKKKLFWLGHYWGRYDFSA